MAARGLPPRTPYSEAQRGAPELPRRTRPSCAAAPACGRRPSDPCARRTTAARSARPSSRRARGRTWRRRARRRAGSGRGGAAAGTATVPWGNANHSQWRPHERLLPRREARPACRARAAAAASASCRGRARGPPARDRRRARAARAPRDRRWASRTWPRRPTSAARTRRRRARACAGRGRTARTGAVAAVAVTTGGGRRRRRRTSGAAMPAASAVTAAARMAVDWRTPGRCYRPSRRPLPRRPVRCPPWPSRAARARHGDAAPRRLQRRASCASCSTDPSG